MLEEEIKKEKKAVRSESSVHFIIMLFFLGRCVVMLCRNSSIGWLKMIPADADGNSSFTCAFFSFFFYKGMLQNI